MRNPARRGIPIVTVLLALLSVLAWPVSADAVTVPYQDAAVIGGIGLCNKAGQPVSGGSIDDRPFVWRAVSAVPAPDGYAVPGGAATLLAYQPRPNVAASEWNGDTLTATSKYTNVRYPMAQATDQDFTLRDYLNEYKPMVNGLVQLRMYVAAPGQGTLNSAYPATDIVVSGSTWTVVRPTAVPCTAGDAHSSELEPTIQPLSDPTPTPVATPVPAATPAPAATSRPAVASGSVAAGSTAPASVVAAVSKASVASGQHPAEDSGNAAWWFVGGAVVAVAGAGALVWRRRRTG